MSKEAYLDESVLTLQDGWFIRLQRVSILCQHIGMVLTRLLNLVNHRRRDLWSTHHAVHDSHLGHSREYVEITCVVIVATRTRIQSPCVWNSVLPQPDNSCKCLPLLIQYPELLSYYCMVCCCEIYACPAHFGCRYESRGISWILEFQLHFRAFIIAHFCIHVEYIHMIRKVLG